LRELLVTEESKKENPNTVYDLIANIVHDGTVHDKGIFEKNFLNS